MDCELRIGRLDNGLLIRVVGRGTMQVCPALRVIFEASDAKRVCFDANECQYLDSTFLGCLVGMKKASQAAGDRHFQIAASPETRRRLFSPTGLAQYFEFVDSCPEVVGETVPLDVTGVAARELGRCVMECHELLAQTGGAGAEAFRSIAERLAGELRET